MAVRWRFNLACLLFGACLLIFGFQFLKNIINVFNILFPMSKAVVFIIAFLCLFALTVVIPMLPPGEMLSSVVGIPETQLISGISYAVIVSGIINGLLWGAVILAIYAVATSPSKKERLPPMISPSYPTAPLPTPTEDTSSVTMSGKVQERKRSRPSPPVKKRRTYMTLDQDVETIEGIGPTYGSKLRIAGVRVVEDLLRAGNTRNKRRLLANRVGVAQGTLLKWVYRADFFRIKGIGTQYSALLESAGVNTVADLSRRNPKNLYAKLREINREKNLVRRVPPYRTVQVWIRKAKNLKRIVED
jgi:predicted flap endonuclease-1-like 5' DNA nuclease